MKERIGIYVNRTASEKYKKQAEAVGAKLCVQPQELVFPLSPIADDIATVIAVGGDGTMKSIAEAMLRRDNQGLLVVIPGGSQNGFYHSLRYERAELTLEQLQDGAVTHLNFFNPGSFNGNIFNHIGDLSQAGALSGNNTERLRGKLPKKLRIFAGILLGFIKMSAAQTSPCYETRTFLTSPFIGSIKIYPPQQLYSDQLTRFRLSAESKREGALKVAIGALYMAAGRNIPPSILEFTSARFFETQAFETQEMIVDGEIRPIPNEGTIYVARHPKAIQAAVLKTEK